MILRHKKIDESSTLRLGDASCTAGGDSNRIVDSHVLRMQHFQHYIKNDRINIDSIPSSFRKKNLNFLLSANTVFPHEFFSQKRAQCGDFVYRRGKGKKRYVQAIMSCACPTNKDVPSQEFVALFS